MLFLYLPLIHLCHSSGKQLTYLSPAFLPVQSAKLFEDLINLNPSPPGEADFDHRCCKFLPYIYYTHLPILPPIHPLAHLHTSLILDQLFDQAQGLGHQGSSSPSRGASESKVSLYIY